MAVVVVLVRSLSVRRIQTEMGMSLSVLKSIVSLHLFRFRGGVRSSGAVQTESETGESVSAPRCSFHNHLLRFHCHFLHWRSLVTTGGEALEDEEDL
jgi:hypothetical protein